MIPVLPLASPDAVLDNAGGKGANLARLSRLGFAVPRGFIIPTATYRAYVAHNGLAQLIQAAVLGVDAGDPDALDDSSQRIRAAFSAGALSADIKLPILQAYIQLPGDGQSKIDINLPVAVRSSATAEDLPDLSFAGQQDTFLNIIGEEQLLKAVIDCWSSLWTARAIGYRIRNSVSHAEAALAVVVQEMVSSDVSGVLFTANPLTGLRSEAVIDAVFGLGEALVSGKVEPDHFVVDAFSGELLSKSLGAKGVSTRGKAGGGVVNILEDVAERQTLSADQIHQLAALGQAVQEEYGAPQDIEWAFADGELYLLQSRPITSLFPVPQVSFDPLIAWFAFGAVQGLVGPITPLGRDTIQHVAVGAGKLFDLELRAEEVKLFVVAGERIWIKVSDVIRNPLGNRLFGDLLGYIEPSIGQILRSLVSDPRFEAGQGRLKLSTVRRLAHFALPVLAQLLRTMLQPEDGRRRFDAAIDEYLKTAQIPAAEDRFTRLANIVRFVRERVANALPFLLPRFITVFGPSMGALNFLMHTSGDKALSLEVTRGLPNNVTTQMDLVLWNTATAVRSDAESRDIFLSSKATTLAATYLAGNLPSAGQAAVAAFMELYGMRGVGEIDIGQPRWRDDPTPVMHALRSYLQIDPEFAPDVQFAKGEKAAKQAIEKLASEARSQSGGWLKEKLVRGMARRIRILMSARESPKFFAIRTMGIAQSALLEVGREFVAARTIENSNDLFFLQLLELEELSREDTSAEIEALNPSSTSPNMNFQRDWKALILKRRGDYQRELRRRQVPRVVVSDGRAFYEGIGSETDTSQVITGSPVSPGVVEGIVHVVLDPHGTQLVPGEILVCPGTDPAWTPLFMAAGGLITEVGGMMTHGSVVAREYGIPAVVGVHQATLRLKNGQRIRLDGASGRIILL